MHILFTTPEFVTENNFDGGLANYLERISYSLIKKGHKITIATASDKEGSIFLNKIKVERIKIPKLPKLIDEILSLLRVKQLFNNIILTFKFFIKYKKINKKHKIDIVQNASYHWTSLLIALFTNAVVVTRSSSDSKLWRINNSYKKNINSIFFEFFERVMLKISDAVYTPSNFLKKYLEKEINKQVDLIRPPYADKISQKESIIYNKSKVKNKKYLLYYGTLSKLKGMEVILDNIKVILKKYKNLYFVFIGKDLYGMDKKIDSILNNKEKERVLILDRMKKTELNTFIQKAEAIIIPSLVDNLPNTAIESLSMGKIVITTKNSSVDELVSHNKNGFLFTKNNSEEFLENIDKLLSLDKKRKKEMETKSKEKLIILDEEKNTELLVKYYQRIIKLK